MVAASEVRRLEERVRELERLLGRKAMEVEIRKEAPPPQCSQVIGRAVFMLEVYRKSGAS